MASSNVAHVIRAPIAVVIVSALVAAAGCTGEQPSRGEPPAAATGEGVTWQPCPELVDELIGDIAPQSLIDEITAQVTYECTTVPVPQDWDDPEAPETFDIALVRARSAHQQDRIGSLLLNPGGPGASGIETAVFLSFGPELGGLPEEITGRFDIVGFDPRGVGKSSPIECYTDAELDDSLGAEPDPVEQADFDELVATIRQQAETCAAKYGEALRLVATRQAAHDLDALRAAVGDDKLTYLGYSYGSLLGAVYAQLYPANIRAMVLDGAVDPEQDSIASSEDQARGFERALDNFAAWCEQTPDDCPLQPDARTAIENALDAARRSPVPGEDGREATAGWIFTAVISALYSQDLWQPLAAALDQLAGGDPTGVFELADSYAQRDTDGAYSNLFDANIAVNCADDATEIAVEQVRDLQGQWREEYPLFGAPLATSVLTCALWSIAPDPYPAGPADGAPPILVVGTLGDPATPYESTARLAEMLGVGVVLTWEGEGHTAYPETACITDAVDAYLLELTVPDEGTTCPA
jgi:pimeloyl-ACP methyl ester carboxylesterase